MMSRSAGFESSKFSISTAPGAAPWKLAESVNRLIAAGAVDENAKATENSARCFTAHPFHLNRCYELADAVSVNKLLTTIQGTAKESAAVAGVNPAISKPSSRATTDF